MDYVVQNIIHFANILYLFSYLVRDILWLRIITVVATLCLLPYFYFRPQPLIEAIMWNFLFLFINGIQIYLLYLERRPVKLTENEEHLYLLAFRCLTKREFKSILEIGYWRNEPTKKILVEEGSTPKELIILVKGDVCVYKDGNPIANFHVGQFINESGIFSEDTNSTSIWTNSDVQMYAWDYESLIKFLKKNPKIHNSIQITLGKSLSEKLKAIQRQDHVN